jgi:hypothetical protein
MTSPEVYAACAFGSLLRSCADLASQVVCNPSPTGDRELDPLQLTALTLVIVPPPLNLDVEGFDEELGVSSLNK